MARHARSIRYASQRDSADTLDRRCPSPFSIILSSPDRDAGARGAGVTAVLGPTNTGKTHLAIERMLGAFVRHHRPAAAAAGARGLQQGASSGSAPRRSRSITGEEKIKPPNPRYWVSTVEAMPRDLDVAFLAIDEIQLGADLERGHVFTDRMLNRRGREETLVLGAATMRPMVERLLPGAHVLTPAAAVAAHLRRREEAHAAAAPLGHRRLLGRGGLCHRRTDPPPARRRRGGARRALAAHPQRAGRALPVRRRRLSGRHRRHRHGAQSRRRSRRLRLRPQVRRLSVPQAQSRPSSRRSPAAPAAPPATAPSAPPAAARRSRPSWCRRWKATRSSRSRCCNGATPRSISPRSARCRRRSPTTPKENGPHPRAGRRGHPGARACRARRRRARAGARRARAVERLWEVCQVPDYRKIAPATHAELVDRRSTAS